MVQGLNDIGFSIAAAARNAVHLANALRGDQYPPYQ
jgi:hypothetical protein